MRKFKKQFNRIITLLAGISFLFTATAVYSSPSKDSLRVPMNQGETKERIQTAADMILSAEGNIAVLHEGDKKKGTFSKKYTLTNKGAKPGVNDVIRELRSLGEGVGYRNLSEEELLEISDALEAIGYKVIADSLKKGRIVSVYNLDKSTLVNEQAKSSGEFVEGITTHFGIRTQNVHITRQEYDRLKELGTVHLAARIAHEVKEIDDWLKIAQELLGKQEIASVGIVEDEFNENWETGIRKWIREKLKIPSGKKEIEDLDRRIHGESLALEMKILITYLIQKNDISSEELCQYLEGTYVLDPNTQEDLFKGVEHFRSKEYKDMFIKMYIVENVLQPCIKKKSYLYRIGAYRDKFTIFLPSGKAEDGSWVEGADEDTKYAILEEVLVVILELDKAVNTAGFLSAEQFSFIDNRLMPNYRSLRFIDGINEDTKGLLRKCIESLEYTLKHAEKKMPIRQGEYLNDLVLAMMEEAVQHLPLTRPKEVNVSL